MFVQACHTSRQRDWQPGFLIIVHPTYSERLSLFHLATLQPMLLKRLSRSIQVRLHLPMSLSAEEDDKGAELEFDGDW